MTVDTLNLSNQQPWYRELKQIMAGHRRLDLKLERPWIILPNMPQPLGRSRRREKRYRATMPCASSSCSVPSLAVSSAGVVRPVAKPASVQGAGKEEIYRSLLHLLQRYLYTRNPISCADCLTIERSMARY